MCCHKLIRSIEGKWDRGFGFVMEFESNFGSTIMNFDYVLMPIYGNELLYLVGVVPIIFE